MTDRDKLADALREALAELEAAEDGEPVAVAISIAYRPEPGVHIASAHLVGDNDGLVAAADGMVRASEKLLDDHDEPEPRRLM